MHYNNSVVPILKIGLIHSQFETIHPFLDGNGRIGRILITLLLHIFKLLDKPILFISSYFKKHQQAYYDTLSSYHKGDVERWLNFFLNGIVDTSNKSIELITRITILVEKDGEKMKTLNKKTAATANTILKKLYSLPIVDTTKVMEWTGFSRPGAQKIIDKLVKMEILTIKDSSKNYGRMYEYKEYLEIFEKD
jgi:Fic family protein